MPSQLDYLRTKSAIDCDTLDASVASSLGPFIDCTSNQAIAYSELLKPVHTELVKTSATFAKTLSTTFPGVSIPTLTTEIASVSLSLLTQPSLSGRMHVQTNPYHSFSTADTILNAQRIIQIFAHLSPSTPKDRISIKIPATWEGLKACEELEKEGIRTLATTLFCWPQVVRAGQVGCTYIAPYVNRLAVHFVAGTVDKNKGFSVVKAAQGWYEKAGIKTKVLPASLISTAEVLSLAGSHHITISPALLQQLSETPYEEATAAPSILSSDYTDLEPLMKTWPAQIEEAAFRLTMNMSNDGDDAGKLVEAINIFCSMQTKMEELVEGVLKTF